MDNSHPIRPKILKPWNQRGDMEQIYENPNASVCFIRNSALKAGTDINIAQLTHSITPPAHMELEEAVNNLANKLKLEKVKLTPDFRVSIRWLELPRGFTIKISDSAPVVVGYRGFSVLHATAGRISSDVQLHDVPLSLPDECVNSFGVLISDILKEEKVELTLRGKISFLEIDSKLDAKMSLDGLDSLRGAIDLEDVKILEAVPEGLRASAKTTIRNRTCFNIEHIVLKSADILYDSTKIGYHKDEKFELLPGENIINPFFWIFTPPPPTDMDKNFREFISKFLTTDEVIEITLDLKKIEVEAGGRLVEFDGTKVVTSIKGINKPLFTRVDVYLWFSALRQEIFFRFTLENPIHAPIEFLDSVVKATSNDQLLSRFVHSFKELAISKFLGQQDSEVVTAKLNNTLLKTIWLIRARTTIELEVNIQECKISIDGREIDNLEFKLHGVKARIHFGKPAGPKPVNMN